MDANVSWYGDNGKLYSERPTFYSFYSSVRTAAMFSSPRREAFPPSQHDSQTMRSSCIPTAPCSPICMLVPSARVPADELALVRGGGVTDMAPLFRAATACVFPRPSLLVPLASLPPVRWGMCRGVCVCVCVYV